MAQTYHKILRNIALRLNTLRSGEPAVLETSFSDQPLTLFDWNGNPPFEAVKDALLMAEEKLADAIANVGDHPWRRVLNGITANVAHKGLLPATDSNSKSIVGIWGSVYDGSDGTVCTEQPLELIRDRVANPNSFFRIASYWYKIDDMRIFHTRTNVKLDCCVYDLATQRTAIDNNSSMLLPDVLDEALMCGGVSYFNVDGSDYYRRCFADALTAISRGLTSVSAKATPGPTLNQNAT